jgi:hypothetical protein
MNFFLANCLQEDNKRAGKNSTYAETGQNTDELQTNKKQEKQDDGVKKKKNKVVATDSAGQRDWPSEPRPVGQGNEYFQSPACCGAGRSRNGCRIRRLGFGAHVVRVLRLLRASVPFQFPGPKSSSQNSQSSHSHTNGVGWVPILQHLR